MSEKKIEFKEHFRPIDMEQISIADESIYVTDIETDEIIYINDEMLQHFGLSRNVIGQRCWQVLQQGMGGRCGFCPIPQLQQNGGLEVVRYLTNHLTGGYYQHTSQLGYWPDGRLVHVMRTVDITTQATSGENLEQRLAQMSLMNTIAGLFITSNQDVSGQIDKALELVRKFNNLHRVSLFLLSSQGDDLVFAHSCYAPEFQDSKHRMEVPLSFRKGDLLYEKLMIKKLPHLTHEDTAYAPEFLHLKEIGSIHAFLVVPVYIDGAFAGIIALDSFEGGRTWGEGDVQLGYLLANTIAAVLTRAKMEKELYRMSQIADSSPQFIAYINENLEFEYLNKGSEQLTGFTVEEFCKCGLQLLCADEVCIQAVNEIIPLTRANGRYEAMLPLRTKSGDNLIVSVLGFLLPEQPKGIAVIASDITAQATLEQELRAAKEQAEQFSMAKTDFLSRMSHEMRTPMNAIIGMTHLARTSDDSNKKEYCLEKIAEASSHLLGVINDILDMSKIEANKMELLYVECELERLLQGVISAINFRIQEKRQVLVVDIDWQMPSYIIIDEQYLRQVLTNLLSNAVKFTPDHGTISLSVRIVSVQDDVYQLRFSVKDSGVGIPLEQQHKVFNAFEQVDGSISRKYGGTGLGLTISNSIVQLMGGTLMLESEVGKGAHFYFEIPVKQGQTQAKPLVPTHDYHNLGILVVDESSEIWRLFQSIAADLAFSCDTAANVLQAQQCIAQTHSPYDCIFVGETIPGGKGLETVRALRVKYPDLQPTLMISAEDWSVIEPNAKQEGIFSFLQKPLFSSQIIRCLNQYLTNDDQIKGKLEPSEAPLTDFSGKRVLIAEDIEINREIIVELLAETQVELLLAENGQHAVELYQAAESPFDLILMDVHMPEMDGLQATQKIRDLELGTGQHTPIVAMTADVFREDIEHFFKSGMDDHVGKPIDVESLISTMCKYI